MRGLGGEATNLVKLQAFHVCIFSLPYKCTSFESPTKLTISPSSSGSEGLFPGVGYITFQGETLRLVSSPIPGLYLHSSLEAQAEN